MKTIIEAKGINKVFKISKNNQYHVLKDVNFKIYAGEFVAVMGSSGSGKSTLLYNISGMDKLNSGKVIFSDTDISEASDQELSNIRLNRMGFVFQQSYLLKDLNIIDNILLPGFTSSKFKRKEVREKGKKLLKELGIEQIANNKVTEASGGQLQRVSIARALINDPEILFGDEPTGSLNSSSTQDVMSIFSSINKRGTTVMVVTHDVKVAARSDRVFFMSDGKLISEIMLGKLDNQQDLLEREERLNVWLIEHGI